MAKIIITGISGFVGQNLSKYLSRNYQVIGMGRNENLNYGNFNSDFDCYAIVHLAGKAHDLKKTSKPEEYYEVNYKLTKKLYDTFLKSKATTFIYMSSVKAVADEVIGELTEETIPNPQTHYGISKYQAEQYILQNQRPDKRVFILRPCIINGEGNKGNLNLLFGIVKKGIPYPLGAFENQRSYLNIENLCFVINELLFNENIQSNIFNVADSGSLSTNQLIETINVALNKKVPILKIPKPIIISIAKLGDVLKLPLNTERLNKLTDNYLVSNRKLISNIKKELPVLIKDGLINTFLTFK
jgi:nucleoside-diphosphate-sugar epimerase